MSFKFLLYFISIFIIRTYYSHIFSDLNNSFFTQSKGHGFSNFYRGNGDVGLLLDKKKKEKKKFLQMYGVAIQATLIDAENEQQKKEMGKDW